MTLVWRILSLIRFFWRRRDSPVDHQCGILYSHLRPSLVQVAQFGRASSHFLRLSRQVKQPG